MGGTCCMTNEQIRKLHDSSCGYANIDEYKTEPITRDQLHGEFEFLIVRRFLESLLADGRITNEEFKKLIRKACKKFSPLYPEIRV